jgi:HEAT repeat protein
MKLKLNTIAYLFIIFIIVAGCSEDTEENQQKELQYYSTRLSDNNGFVRVEAASKLAEIGEPVIPILIEALSDSNPQVRLNAAFALGEIGSPTAVPMLIARLNDSEWEVRANVAIALSKIGKAAVPGLIAALKDNDSQVRSNATQTLGQIGDADAVPALIAILNDPVWEVRASAATALGEIGEAAVPALIKALTVEDEDVFDMAIWALKIIGTPQALTAVEEASLKHPKNLN